MHAGGPGGAPEMLRARRGQHRGQRGWGSWGGCPGRGRGASPAGMGESWGGKLPAKLGGVGTGARVGASWGGGSGAERGARGGGSATGGASLPLPVGADPGALPAPPAPAPTGARLGPVQHGLAGPCRAGAAAARRGTLRRGRCAPPRPAARLLSLRCSPGWRRREAEPGRAVPGPGWAGMDGPGGGQLPTAAPSRAKLPLGIVFSTALFCGESAAAAVLCFSYSHSDDRFWLALTVFFMLCPSVLVQLTLIFVHRDLSRDRPLVLLMHLLQLGPIIR